MHPIPHPLTPRAAALLAEVARHEAERLRREAFDAAFRGMGRALRRLGRFMAAAASSPVPSRVPEA